MTKLLPDGVVLLAFLAISIESNDIDDSLRISGLVLL